MSSQSPTTASRITLATLRKIKEKGGKFAVLTAYDATFGAMLDEAGIEIILVGDSLGMVIQGEETTIPVTMEHMQYHTRLVAGSCHRALVMVDMPFLSFASPAIAIENAARLMRSGGHMVKLEGGRELADTVHQLSLQGIPICAHIGLRPQSIHKAGGYRVQGRDTTSANALMDDARALEAAGTDILLLECVLAPLARAITESVSIPVIGIGAGNGCDGQVLVLYDMLGITRGRVPKFVKNFLPEGKTLEGAVAAYGQAVREGVFPGPEHSFE